MYIKIASLQTPISTVPLSPSSSALPVEYPPTPYPSVAGSYPYAYSTVCTIVYSQRHCTLCPGGVLGDETHIVTECPQLNLIFHQHTHPFRVLFRLCDLTSVDRLSPEDRLRAMLGNPPPGMLIRNMPVWISEGPARSGRFAYDLQAHIATHAPSLTVCPSSDSDAFQSPIVKRKNCTNPLPRRPT